MKRTFLTIIAVLCMVPVASKKYQLRRDGRVLAHSLNFDPQHITADMPPALQEILRAYQTQPRYGQRMQGRAVAPLLKSTRHQSDPYNRSCPYYKDDEGVVSEERCLVGCVATCLEQVLTYYRYPKVLLDTLHGWETDHYQVGDVLPGTRIDWDNILYDYNGAFTDQQAQAVSDLSYYCGMAVHMSWGVGSSGASISRALEPLSRVFGYKTAVHRYRGLYSSPQWNALLRHELEEGRPICYTGHNIALGGHAFNIDGVDAEGYYHVNWGYGGDYDGYFDLDHLTPFEPVDEPTLQGLQIGLFANHAALFIHPDKVDIDITDSLTNEVAFAGVTVDDITFRRQPDTEGYTIADFTMTNHTTEKLNYTFEVLTYLPTDTAIFYQADYVALSAVDLLPGETKTWAVYCQFTEMGERILSFSADDETLPYKMPVNIVKGTRPVLEFSDVACRQMLSGDNLMADFSMEVTNKAQWGYAGRIVTFCLFPEGESVDTRHWQILSTPAGGTEKLSARFQHLVDGQTYTLLVRCPWDVVKEYTFRANSAEAVDGISDTLYGNGQGATRGTGRVYDLSGRPVLRPTGSIYVKEGKKFVKP